MLSRKGRSPDGILRPQGLAAFGATITLDTDAHVVQDTQDRAVEAIDAALSS